MMTTTHPNTTSTALGLIPHLRWELKGHTVVLPVKLKQPRQPKDVEKLGTPEADLLGRLIYALPNGNEFHSQIHISTISAP